VKRIDQLSILVNQTRLFCAMLAYDVVVDVELVTVIVR